MNLEFNLQQNLGVLKFINMETEQRHSESNSRIVKN
jgi:hypothetical protein